ncbi:MAG: putative metal-binding motif-containing protein [Alphaproteobacteria bacterium]|nr:putative metal-binding motif-containing protein [Alphaproteobacteria bacterium]
MLPSPLSPLPLALLALALPGCAWIPKSDLDDLQSLSNRLDLALVSSPDRIEACDASLPLELEVAGRYADESLTVVLALQGGDIEQAEVLAQLQPSGRATLAVTFTSYAPPPEGASPDFSVRVQRDGTAAEELPFEVEVDPAPAWYADADADGVAGGEPTYACTPSGESEGPDCDDGDNTVFPGAAEVCDGLDNDCDGTVPANEVDADGDSWRLCDEDCDDDDSNRHPMADEVAGSGVDANCDGVLLCFEDLDGDGYGAGTVELDASQHTDCDDTSVAAVALGGDCDDTEPARSPGNTEVVNSGIDEDCSGDMECYVDGDSDGFGIAAVVALTDACDVPAGGDCDDAEGTIYPGAPEVVADGIDTNCDGVDDCYEDIDGDGHGTTVIVIGLDLACQISGTATSTDDCDDADTTVHPGAPELCDGIDNDCNGIDAEESDADGDGYVSCSPWVGSLPGLDGGDCDDVEPRVHPGHVEICDGIRNDCTPQTADLGALAFWVDGTDVATDDFQDALDALSDGGEMRVCGTGGDPQTTFVLTGAVAATLVGSPGARIRGSISLQAGSLTFEQLELTGGPATQGGALSIANAAEATLLDTDITCTDVQGVTDGGGIWVAGALQAASSDVTGCLATGNGGGIHVSSGATVDLTNVDLTGNSAGGNGGGLWTGAPLTGTDLNLFDNTATNGGGVFVASGALHLISSTFDNNAATGNGGGLYLGGSNGRIDDAVFTLNQAPSGDGGGVYLTGAGHDFLTNLRLVENSAADGGAIYLRNTADFPPTATMSTNTATVGGNFTVLSYVMVPELMASSNQAPGGSVFRVEELGDLSCPMCTMSGNGGGATAMVWTSDIPTYSSHYYGGGVAISLTCTAGLPCVPP